MIDNIGIWIDHRKAIIVRISDKGAEMSLTISGVEKQLRRTGDLPMKGSYEAQKVPADDSRTRAFVGQLNIYYDAVIACLKDVNHIQIYGPGIAKTELKKRLAKSGLGKKIVGVVSADKMTNAQFTANVRKKFANK